jgi:hypothetical protein
MTYIPEHIAPVIIVSYHNSCLRNLVLGLVQEEECMTNRYLAKNAFVDYLRWMEDLERVL